MESKTQKISRYISSSRAEMQLPVLEVRAHNAAVEEWLNRVRFVPVEYLDECYQMAMDAHSNRTPLIPKEILAQWQIISARPGFRDKQQFEEKRCPHYCSIAGWIIVNSEDVMQMNFMTSEYLYAKPCPIHRPQGAKLDPFIVPGKRVAKPETIDERSVGFNTGLPVEGFRSAGRVAVEQTAFARLREIETNG